MNPAFRFFSPLLRRRFALWLLFCGGFCLAGLAAAAAAETARPNENFIRRQILKYDPPADPAPAIKPLKTQPFISSRALPPPSGAPITLDEQAKRLKNAAAPAAPPAGKPAPQPQKTVIAAPQPLPMPKLALPAAAAFAAEENSRTFPRFGDRKPHIWTSANKPWHYPIHGTDISWHNKNLDWNAMARAAISFVFIKATEGGDFADPAFAENWQAAKAAGLKRGAYHFYYFCRAAKEQLRWFIRNVPNDKTALPPVLDMEWNRTSPTCRRHPAPAIIRKDMRLFLRGLENHYGKRPIIYTTVDFFHDNELGRFFKAYPFWLRSVAGHPEERYKNRPWLFWQYTGTGRVPGIGGDADISVFAGSSSQWQHWLQKAQ